MEIAGLGMINPEDYRISPALHAPGNFQEILERVFSPTQAEDSSRDELSGAGVSGGAEINTSRFSANMPVDKNDRLYQLCLELETFLVKNLLTSMRNTVQKSGLIDEGFAGKMYEDMLYDEYAKVFTKSANFGLAEMAYRQLASI